MLQERRNFEINYLEQYEKKENANEFYFINKEWYDHWKMFIYNDQSDSSHRDYKSPIMNVGLKEPGLLNNYPLFTEKGDIKKGLIEDEDYIAVNEDIWNFIFENYRGGPLIKRENSNIYSQSLDTYEEEQKFNNVCILVSIDLGMGYDQGKTNWKNEKIGSTFHAIR